MNGYHKELGNSPDAIITDSYIFPNFKPRELPKLKYYSNSTLWDTGAEQTMISSEIVEGLQLAPIQQTQVLGIGGIEDVNIYEISIGLPNGKVYHNYKVMASDTIVDYDVIIGMDIIRECDFCLTNKDNVCIFSFRNPSEERIIFE